MVGHQLLDVVIAIFSLQLQDLVLAAGERSGMGRQSGSRLDLAHRQRILGLNQACFSGRLCFSGGVLRKLMLLFHS